MNSDALGEAVEDARAIKRMRDKDVLFSLLLLLGSVAVIVYAFRISFAAIDEMEAEFYTAPGFFVIIVGAGIFLLALLLLLTALRQGGSLHWLAPTNLARLANTKSSRQTMLVFTYLFLYMWLFWEEVPLLRIHVPFWLSTFVFLCLMTITFNRRNILGLVLISGAATALIDVTFRVLVRVPLP